MRHLYCLKCIIAMVLACASMGAASQIPSSGPSIGPQRPQDRASSAPSRQSREESRGSEKSPIFVKQLPSELATSERKAESDDREQRASDARWTVGATVATAAFTGVLTVFTVLLWRETKKSAAAAMDSVMTMRDSANKQLRSYVFVENIDLAFISLYEAPSSNLITITLKNFGTTPASVRKLASYFVVGEAPTALDTTQVREATVVLGPGGTSIQRVDRPLRPSDLESVLGKKAGLYFVCHVDYEDILGQKQETSSCWKYNVDSSGHKFIPSDGSPLNRRT